ncbi:MAG: hypothetical protein ACRCYY_05590 [Trueperaceae bacterium]
MKRFVVLMFLMSMGFTQAQSNWFGVRTGYPLGITLHYGIVNGLDNGFDLRVSGNIRQYGGVLGVGIGVDGMNDIVRDGPLSVYVGVGPALDFSNSGVLLDLHGLIGGEIRLSAGGLGALGIFVEGTIGATIGLGRDSYIPAGGAAIGFNWHF